LSLDSIHKSASLILEDLINFLHVHFRKYFLIDEPPPWRIRWIAIQQFEKDISCLRCLTPISDDYLNLIISALEHSINNPDAITYRLINFFKEVVKLILSYKSDTNNQDFSTFLKKTLFYLNFNSNEIIDLIVHEFEIELAQLNSTQSKIEKITFFLKEVEHARVNCETGFLPKNNSIKEQASDWLQAELCFLEKQVQLLNSNIPYSIKTQKNFVKIKINLSIDELALILKAFERIGVLSEKDIPEIAQSIACYTNTKKQSNLSPKSLRNKIYCPDSKTIDPVKGIIIRILEYLKSL
jgi:hypothetical protein